MPTSVDTEHVKENILVLITLAWFIFTELSTDTLSLFDKVVFPVYTLAQIQLYLHIEKVWHHFTVRVPS